MECIRKLLSLLMFVLTVTGHQILARQKANVYPSHGDDGQPWKDGHYPTIDSLDQAFDVVPLRLVNLAQHPFAKCLDGTPAGFYYKPASTKKNKNSWLVHLQGGGECADARRCRSLAMTKLGSSRNFPQFHNFRGDSVDVNTGEELGMQTDLNLTIVEYQPLLNTNKSANPDFYDWNMVFVQYCSQDLWLGRRKSNSDDTFWLYFSGEHIFEAVIDILDIEHNMKAATNLVLSGDSAGAYGAIHHLDAIAEKHPSAKTVGSAVGGLWDHSFPYTGAGHTFTFFADFRRDNWPNMKRLWRPSIKTECAEAHDGNRAACLVGCSSAPYPWTLIKSRVFLGEALIDSVQAIMHNWVPPPPVGFNGLFDPQLYSPEIKQFLRKLGQNFSMCLTRGMDTLMSQGKKNVGFYSPSCFIHTGFEDPLKIEGRSYKEAFGDFFFERGPTPMLIEKGFLTNPTCKQQFHAAIL